MSTQTSFGRLINSPSENLYFAVVVLTMIITSRGALLLARPRRGGGGLSRWYHGGTALERGSPAVNIYII